MRLQPDRNRQPVARPAVHAPMILLALLLAASAAGAADDIATFDDGVPALTSYPGQDSQPAAWSLVTGWGGAGIADAACEDATSKRAEVSDEADAGSAGVGVAIWAFGRAATGCRSAWRASGETLTERTPCALRSCKWPRVASSN